MPIVADGKSVNVCQGYNGRHFCGTSLQPDGHYSAWDYCDSAQCPLTGKYGGKECFGSLRGLVRNCIVWVFG